MTEQELLEIEKRCEAATPGPWGKLDRVGLVVSLGDCKRLIAEVRKLRGALKGEFDSGYECAQSNAKEEIRLLRAENSALRDVVIESGCLLDAATDWLKETEAECNSQPDWKALSVAIEEYEIQRGKFHG